MSHLNIALPSRRAQRALAIPVPRPLLLLVAAAALVGAGCQGDSAGLPGDGGSDTPAGDGQGQGDGGAGGDGGTGSDALPFEGGSGDGGACPGGGATRPCYSGPAGTAGVGACRPGVETCSGAGIWSACVGDLVPGAEACNGEDDDCNGMTDEALGVFTCGVGACQTSVPACVAAKLGLCMPLPAKSSDGCGGGDEDCDGAVDEDCLACVPVSPAGNDTTADGTKANPFATIQAAVDWSAADASRAKIVCVAGGTDCGKNATYASAAGATITMKNGVSVYGSYESTGWTRCALGGGGSLQPQTTITPKTAPGVTFPATVTTATGLGGFRIDRFDAGATGTTAAVTVDGGKNVTLSDLVVQNTPTVDKSYAVDVHGGADVTITRVSLYAGNGTSESIGVRVVGSRATLRNICKALDAAGRCKEYCGGGTEFAIRGRFTASTSGVSWGVLLQDAPGSSIEQTTVCGASAKTGASIRVTGAAAGVVIRQSHVNAWGGVDDAHGIWLDDCGGAAPWIVDNYSIEADGTNGLSRVDGIRAMGDCHPVIDKNLRIAGGGEGAASNPNGIYCGAQGGKASRCAVLGNLLVQGAGYGFPPVAVAVRCDDDACLRIAGNVIDGHGGVDVTGVWLQKSGTLVERNKISGGCGTKSSTGILARDSFARIENNLIRGSTCGAMGAGGAADNVGVLVEGSAGSNEVDLHSNTIDGGGAATACTSTAVRLGIAAPAPTGPAGVFRNNILRIGACTGKTYGLQETDPAADPRLMENNDFDPTGPPGALYRDEAATDLATIAAVNALSGAAANIWADPKFGAYPVDARLMSLSPCIDAGTAAFAPATDYAGKARGAKPDIGAYEY